MIFPAHLLRQFRDAARSDAGRVALHQLAETAEDLLGIDECADVLESTDDPEQPDSQIMTYTGRWVDPLNMDPESVCIEDIAHSLATTNRFTGHARVPYSVAEHCVRMSNICPPDLALECLMHDVGEAYLPDVASPVKPALFGFQQIEDQVEAACRRGLGMVGDEHHPDVKHWDLVMLVTEARDLGLRWWNWRYLDVEPLPTVIRPWHWSKAKQLFLGRYAALR